MIVLVAAAFWHICILNGEWGKGKRERRRMGKGESGRGKGIRVDGFVAVLCNVPVRSADHCKCFLWSRFVVLTLIEERSSQLLGGK